MTKALVLLAAAAGQMIGVSSLQLFNGKQADMFSTMTISSACNAALNVQLNCPSIVQSLTYPDYALDLTPDVIKSLCASTCLSSISNIGRRLASSCQNDKMKLQLGETSFAQLGALVQQRVEFLCLKESSGGRFCRDVMAMWDIPGLEQSGKITWPQNPPKCLRVDGECHTLEDLGLVGEEGGPEEDLADFFSNGDYAGADFFTDRSGVLEAAKGHSLGSSKSLDWDEFPLEIQCHPCFWKTFSLGHRSEWAHMVWSHWTEQTWENMVSNCNIPPADAQIVPLVNMTALIEQAPDVEEEEGEDPEPEWDLCPDVITVSQDNEYSLWEWTHKASLATACIRSWNPSLPGLAWSLQGRKVCAPLTCEIAIAEQTQPIEHYVEENHKNFGLYEFLRWNKCLNSGSTVWKGDSVCIGPHRGRYTPSVVPVAEPTAWTTTATPSTSPPPMTIRNCGRYHVVTESDTCAVLSIQYGITVKVLRNMNPTIDSVCSSLAVGRSYCVAPVDGTDVPDITMTFQQPSITRTSTGASPTTTQPSNGIQTPSPVQPGMVTNCNAFATVRPTTTCQGILDWNKITLENFFKWNPAVRSDCSGIQTNTWACIGVIESPDPITTTLPGNGISTPTPTQSGMVTNCNAFATVRPTTTCQGILDWNKISLADFFKWNPAVRSDCTGLQPNTWACIGVLPPPVVTPSPTQPGMISGCTAFATVRPTTTCQGILDWNKITLANFFKWNPAVRSDCTGLQPNTWACIGAP